MNRGPWKYLESAVRKLAREGNTVHVVTGPLFESWFGELPQADEAHQLPSGFFKVISVNTGGSTASVAFIMPQQARQQDNFCQYRVSLEQVEVRSGMDIMPGLAPALSLDGGALPSRLGC